MLAFACKTHQIAAVAQTRKKPAVRRRNSPEPTGTGKHPTKIALTLRLDAERVSRLQAIAEAENRSLTNFVETVLLRDLSRRDEADRVITMHAAPGTTPRISRGRAARRGRVGRSVRGTPGSAGRTVVDPGQHMRRPRRWFPERSSRSGSRPTKSHAYQDCCISPMCLAARPMRSWLRIPHRSPGRRTFRCRPVHACSIAVPRRD